MESLEALARAHAQAWLDLAASTAAVAQLPARTLHALTGLGPAPQPTQAELAARAREEAHAALAQLEKLQGLQGLVDELRRAYAALELEAAQRASLAIEDHKRTIFGLLEPLLMQLPAVKRSVDEGREVGAADVLALLGPLDELVANLGVRAIGAPGEETPFDPTRHQPTSGAAPDAGDPVTIKTVGFELDGKILRRARVTRAKQPAPGGALQ